MTARTMTAKGALAVALATLLLPAAARAQQTITIDGSSTVFPPTEAVAEEFQNAKKGQVRVTVGISGTGGGFKKFCRGETDISNASRPILKEEMELCKQNGISYFELPIAFDAMTVAVNPKNNWVDTITVDELKKLWEPGAQGKVTKWNQIRPEWPDREIKLYGAGADSGTFDYFTEAVVGKAKSSRGDYTASEDDNVLVQGIETDQNALGYLPFAYYAPHADRMKALAIKWKDLPAVKPSLEAVVNGQYNPLSRPLFIYVSEKSAKKPEVRDFIKFYMSEGPALVKEVKYLPLPDQAYKVAMQRFESGKTGTGFGGVSEVGLPVEELLKREPKS
ncbi:MAG TPA: PstS family phosphate ABC transporter substrate-binding protein [Azospirillum sp.]